MLDTIKTQMDLEKPLKKLKNISKKLELKRKFSNKTIKIFHITVSLILIIYWTILIIYYKSEIFKIISKFLTFWGLVITTIYFFRSLFISQKEIYVNNHFLHFLLTLEITIFFSFWMVILPTAKLPEITPFLFFENIFNHFIIQIFLFIEFFLTKSFFLNSKINLFLHSFVFFIYIITNLIYLKVFNIEIYNLIEWNSYIDIILSLCLITFVFFNWYFLLWSQRFKFKILDDFKNDKEITKHFFRLN